MLKLRPPLVLAILLAGCAHHIPDHRAQTYATFDAVTPEGRNPNIGLRVWIQSSGWWASWVKYITTAPSVWATGTWRRSGSWLVLSQNGEADRRWLYTVVGADAYLVPEAELAMFCAARHSRLRRVNGELPFAPIDADKVCAKQ